MSFKLYGNLFLVQIEIEFQTFPLQMQIVEVHINHLYSNHEYLLEVIMIIEL